MGAQGEIRINQAKRGYEYTSDGDGQLAWINPYGPNFPNYVTSSSPVSVAKWLVELPLFQIVTILLLA